MSWAPPLPPEIIAPAWPILRPGGAVIPAINPTIGFFILWFFTNSAASSSAVPPISPIIKMDFVSSSLRNRSKQSIKLVPFIGSPPIPMHVDWPKPFSVVWATASYVNVPDLETIPTEPRLWMLPGIIPILHSSGVIIPGQFGPINLLFDPFNFCLTLSISWTGIPSVIQTINSIDASIASIIAAAANLAGT